MAPGSSRRELPPSSPFADDDGGCDPRLAAALAVENADRRVFALARTLPEVRVLVPVVAHSEASAGDLDAECNAAGGRPHAASAAVVTVRGPDGRAVLPVFSGVGTLSAWDGRARPMPVMGRQAALAAVEEADGLLVLDPAGPVPTPLPRPAVWAVARGRAWRPAPEDREVAVAVEGGLAPLAGVVAVRCEPGRRAELAVVLSVRAGLDRTGLDALVAAAGRVLSTSEVVAERVDSLELRILAAPHHDAGRARRGSVGD